LAVDNQGNLYIADGGLRIRKVSPDGVISTVAGTGEFGYSGDGGPAIKARFGVATGLAVDSAGDLFILDTENNRVRMVSPDGMITTVAGTGTPGFSGDGGPATSAQLGITSSIHGVNPTGLAIDSVGNLYIADDGNVRVRKVSPSGIITTVAGNLRTLGYSGDGGPATDAQMSFPAALAVDNAGNLYIGEGNRVRRVSPEGIITTAAGGGFGGYSGDGGPAASARIGYPHGLAADSYGNVFVADQGFNVIRMLRPVSDSTAASAVTSGNGQNCVPR
jgi:sugar lactone lactonase YvrE